MTPAADLDTIETVLDAINADLVALLNRRGAHAIGLSGSDAALLRARKLVRADGKDLGEVGELVEVNKTFLESLLAQSYIPVIAPVGLGANGESYNMNADLVASGIATALGVDKLIFLGDVAGHHRQRRARHRSHAATLACQARAGIARPRDPRRRSPAASTRAPDRRPHAAQRDRRAVHRSRRRHDREGRVVSESADTRARRAAIVELVRTPPRRDAGRAARSCCSTRGLDVTQATLSRDLAKLHARRVSSPTSGTAYELDGFHARTGTEPAQLAAMAELVLAVRDGDAMVVIHTRPGVAPAVAALIDQARFDTVIGTIAGDDTIFVAPERKVSARTLAKRLQQLFAR